MRLTRLLALAAIGTGVALLFTTKKGKALRGDIADKSGDLLNKLTKLTKEATSDMLTAGNGARKAVKEHV